MALTKITGTGLETLSDGVTITTADNTAQLTLISTDADANVGPDIILSRQSSSAADNDQVGSVKFVGHNDAGTPEDITYTQIVNFIEDATDGSEDGILAISSIVNGTDKSRLKFTGSEAVFNENSADLDFRVESDNNASALFVQGSSGNVGIGTTAPAHNVEIVATAAGSVNDSLQIRNNATSSGTGSRIRFINSTDNTSDTNGASISSVRDGDDNDLVFETENTERVRIQSSTTPHLLVGCTSAPSSSVAGTAISTTDAGSFQSFAGGTTQSTHAAFGNTNGVVGSIQTTNSTTAYNTSSDYRLKENVNYTWDATIRLKQLKPARFNFIANANTIVDGFLAHEAQAVVPEAITGTKDEIKIWKDGEELPDGVSVGDNKLDDDGNTIPIMQGIDQSKLVPLLVKSLQEAVIKIETLEAKVTALENA